MKFKIQLFVFLLICDTIMTAYVFSDDFTTVDNGYQIWTVVFFSILIGATIKTAYEMLTDR